MKKSFIFIILIINIGLIHSQTNYYHYGKKKDYRIRTASFHRYVIPQARTILSEFKSFLAKLNPIYKDLFIWNDQFDDFKGDYQKWVDRCFSVTVKNCHRDLTKLKKDSYKIESRFLNLLIKSNKSLDHFDKNIHSYSQFFSIYQLISSLPHQVQSIEVNWGTPLYEKKNEDMIINRLIEIEQQLQFFRFNYLESKHQGWFEIVWLNFFNPLKIHIIKDKDKEFLLRSFERLNKSYNIFHMNCTKSANPLKKELEPYFDRLRSRWNSILKIILN